MTEFNDNQIDDFLLGRISKTEAKDIEKLLSMDKEFATRVQARKKTLQYVGILGDLALKSRVQQIHKEALKGLPPKKVLPVRTFIKYAAAILLLVFSGYWGFNSLIQKTVSFEQYYGAYDLNFVTRDGTIDTQIAEAGLLYNNKDFSNALSKFDAIPIDSLSAKALLAKGICNIEVNQPTEAISTFEILLERKDPIFQEHTFWYMAMAYLKSGDKNKTRYYLDQLLKDTNAFKTAEAQEILKNL